MLKGRPIKNKPGTADLSSSLRTSRKRRTAPKRTPERLRESEERYRALYDDNPSMYFTVDRKGTVLSVNRFGAKQLGYTVRELVGRSVLTVFHKEDRDGVRTHLQTCLAQPNSVHQWEVRKVRKDGTELWVKETARGVEGPDGESIVLIVCEDITERRRAEEALRLVIQGTSLALGADFFRALVHHLVRALSVRFAFVSELCASDKDRVRLLSLWAGTAFGENFEYELRGTPCERVFADGLAYFPADVHELFPKDRWLQQNGIKSYLAVPMYSPAGDPIGHLGVMDDGPMPDDLPRASILQIFAARAGAELERKRSEEVLRAIVEGTTAATGEDFFRFLVRHFTSALNVRYAFVTECLDSPTTRVRTLAFWTGEGFGENVEYDLAGTPCEQVMDGRIRHHPESIQVLFPKDQDLVDMDAQSYLGAPLFDSSGVVIGHLAVLDDKPMFDRPRFESIVQVFAARAAAELERRKTDRALRESEERFRDYFKLQSIGIAITSPDKRWIDVNDKLCEIFGYSRDELLQLSWPELTHPDDLPANLALFNRAVAGELDEFSLEKRFIRKEGTVVYTRLSVRCLHYPNREVDYFLVLYEDITERKRAEAALRESEEHFRNLIEGSIQGILIHKDWKPLFVNQAYAHILGYDSPEEILAMESIASFVAPHERARMLRYRKARLKGESAPTQYEYEAIRKDGTPVVLQNLVRVVNWKGQRVVQHTVIDITEHKRADEALRKSEQRLRRLFEQSNDAVFIHTLDGQILKVNARACEMLGYDIDQLVAMPIGSLHPEEEHEASRRALEITGEQGSTRFESRFRKADGTEIDVEISARIVDREKGVVQGIVRDITERKRAERRLRQYRDRLRTLASKMSLTEEGERRRIAADLHDRTVQTLGLSRIKLDTLRESLRTTGHSSILEEIRGLIDQTIHDTRSLLFELSPPVLYELGFEPAVEWLVERMQDEHGIVYEVRDDQQPKPLGKDVQVVLFQAVRELLANVGKHAKASQAQLALRREGDYIIIGVQDDGVGFDTAAIGTPPFERGGFGLFSIRERLQLLGGHLEIDAAPGEGTRVTLTAPLQSESGT